MVHALLHGQPLCGFSRTVPRDWPEGESWVHTTELELITCHTCKRKAKDLAEKEKVNR